VDSLNEVPQLLMVPITLDTTARVEYALNVIRSRAGFEAPVYRWSGSIVGLDVGGCPEEVEHLILGILPEGEKAGGPPICWRNAGRTPGGDSPTDSLAHILLPWNDGEQERTQG
jgi:hypothetical protein